MTLRAEDVGREGERARAIFSRAWVCVGREEDLPERGAWLRAPVGSPAGVLVVRIDDVGRAEAVVYDASRYQPQPPELRYFLTQFVVKHFSRIRSTLQREYPDSLFFLNPALADATIAQNDQTRVLEMFVTNPTADEIEVAVQNVSLSELSATPFKAAVTFQKLYYTPGTRSERNRETYVAQVDFVLREHVPNEFVRVNPLGLQIEYFRVDQAFEEGRR